MLMDTGSFFKNYQDQCMMLPCIYNDYHPTMTFLESQTQTILTTIKGMMQSAHI